MEVSEEIVKRNLERICSRERGGGMDLLLTESLGGNAGDYNGFSCAFLNFFYNLQGEIKYFGNYQEVPIDIRDKCLRGGFKMAIETFRYRIVSVLYDKRASRPANLTIQTTGRAFNRQEAEEEPKRKAERSYAR